MLIQPGLSQEELLHWVADYQKFETICTSDLTKIQHGSQHAIGFIAENGIKVLTLSSSVKRVI
jgi:hypothetical protein